MKRRSSSSRDNVSPNRKQPLLSITVEPLDVGRRIWPLILPYLSLCDIESISQTSPLLQELVESFITLLGVQIEECCLKTSPEILKKYGRIVSKLTLKRIPESEAHKLIGYFKCLTSFTIVDMIILSEIPFPMRLTELFLIDCQFERGLLEGWFSQLRETLKKLHLRNIEDIFSPPVNFFHIDVTSMESLESLTVEKDVLHLFCCAKQLKYLKVRSNDLRQFRLTGNGHTPVKPSNLRQLHLDVPGDILRRFSWELDGSSHVISQVQRLTTRNLMPLDELRKFKCLNQMEVLCPVDLKYKDDIEAMNQIQTLKLAYNSASQPPKDTDLILKQLKDYCWLEIIKRLEVHEWMSLGRVHPKIERILVQHFYPRVVIADKDIDNSKIAEDLPHLQRVAQSIREYESDWDIKHLPVLQNHLTALTSLTLHGVFFRYISIEELPGGLEKLVLNACRFNATDLTPYFSRLKQTLRVLEVNGGSMNFQAQWLKELHNMREIKIQSLDVIAELELFLKRNENSLERVEIGVARLPEDIGWAALGEVLDLIGSMQKVKVLEIRSSGDPAAVNFHLVVELIKKVGPQLTRLTVDFLRPEMKEVLESEQLRDLEELVINVRSGFREIAVSAIASMKHLRKLTIDIDNDSSSTLPASDLIVLVKALSKLTAISTFCFQAELCFGLEFQEYLRTEKRTLDFNEVSFPRA